MRKRDREIKLGSLNSNPDEIPFTLRGREKRKMCDKIRSLPSSLGSSEKNEIRHKSTRRDSASSQLRNKSTESQHDIIWYHQCSFPVLFSTPAPSMLMGAVNNEHAHTQNTREKKKRQNWYRKKKQNRNEATHAKTKARPQVRK